MAPDFSVIPWMPLLSTTDPLAPILKPAPLLAMMPFPSTRTRCPVWTGWPARSISNSAAPDSSFKTNLPCAAFAHQTVPSKRMASLALGSAEFRREICSTLVMSNAGWLVGTSSAAAVCVANPAPNIKLQPARTSRIQAKNAARMKSGYLFKPDSARRNGAPVSDPALVTHSNPRKTPIWKSALRFPRDGSLAVLFVLLLSAKIIFLQVPMVAEFGDAHFLN